MSAEPEGSIRYSVLMAQVGDFMGHGYGTLRDDPEWGRREAYRVADATAGGVLQVYKPPTLPGDAEPHQWSFLRPFVEVVIASGDDHGPLPADFAGFEGDVAIRLSGSSAQSQNRIKRTQIGHISHLRGAHPAASGPPEWFAEEPLKGVTDDRGQRWRMAVWPAANQAYTVRCQMYFNPVVAASGVGDYVYGGQDHANLFLASVKYWAASHYGMPERAELERTFMAELQGSVGRDRRRKGANLGYNGDGRGRVWGTYRQEPWWLVDGVSVTYGGQVW